MNIFPIHDRSVGREEKESLLDQKGQAFWLTGLSGSGKSTIALAVERRLIDRQKMVILLDGDNVRNGLCKDLSFSEVDRRENIRRISELVKILVENGLVVLCTFISPQEEMREEAKRIIGEDDFHLIFVDAPIDLCIERDPKGLYAKAIRGEIDEFTGISAPFDPPSRPDLVIDTAQHTMEESSQILFDYILKNIPVK